jgi:hypothetical protein
MPMDKSGKASRLGPRDLKSPDGVMGGPRGACKSKSIWQDGDGVDQVREKGDGKFK